jgi:hypothetical protein
MCTARAFPNGQLQGRWSIRGRVPIILGRKDRNVGGKAAPPARAAPAQLDSDSDEDAIISGPIPGADVAGSDLEGCCGSDTEQLAADPVD